MLERRVHSRSSNDNRSSRTPDERRRPLRDGEVHRVMLVDDNREFVNVLSNGLRMLGYEVAFAFDARECLANAIPFRPHSILIDIAMPETNGWDLARKILTLPILAYPRLIAVSAFAQPIHRARSMAAGFEYHVVKPVRIATLDALLRT
jgi:CheY-like chemotaxis protein